MTESLQNIFLQAESTPGAISLDLRNQTPPERIDLSDLFSAVEPEVISLPVKCVLPRVISIPINNPTVRVRDFTFPEPEKTYTFSGAEAKRMPEGQYSNVISAASTQTTRIKPPGDVIKLEDRLHYLLQPSLESLLSQGSLGFPCRPYTYQFTGMAFLYPRHAAILADEMGLGKTMQAITAVRLLLHRGEVSRVLLICPKSLVTNWQREFQQWAPEVPVMVIEGDQAKRAWQWHLPDVPVRIANYEILLRDREVFENHQTVRETSICHPERSEGSPYYSSARYTSDEHRSPIQFDLVLLDESQRIKNRTSTTNQIVCALSRKRSWALTGTPVENSTEDLVGIFEFLAPGLISPEMKPRIIGRTISDYVLRRTKDQVLADLPPKIVHDEHLELTPEQRETYKLAEEEGILRLTEMGASATIQHVFELVLRLKQICNFDPATRASAKLERLWADVEEIAQSNRKAIVFSQWVSALKQLSGHLAPFGPLEYHGQIPSRQRDGVIERFREDDSSHVLLISYGAGGVGLNLQFANYVFLFDRWWNPAVEDQAINRAHRIGIDSPTYVTRFLMLDTIEERIDSILQAKRELFDTIFSDSTGQQKMGLTQEELFGLFRLKCPSGPIDLAA